MSGMLENKVAVVTGAAGGIGKAICRQLRDAGATVVATDIAKPEEENHGNAAWTQLDVTAEKAVRSVFAQIREEFGRIDILVNNAGLLRLTRLADMTTEEWDEVNDVNIKGAFLCTREAVRDMIGRSSPGKIINISSSAARVGFGNQSHYCSAKAGMLGFTKGLAVELATHGITVNAICPGPVDTEMLDLAIRVQSENFKTDIEEYEKRVIGLIPLGHKLQPDDVAAGVVYLASPGADNVTGQTISIDGGVVRI